MSAVTIGQKTYFQSSAVGQYVRLSALLERKKEIIIMTTNNLSLKSDV